MQSDLENLIKLLSKLPGLGSRSARRAVLDLIKNRESKMQPLIKTLQLVEESVLICETCGNVDTSSPCAICVNERRDDSLICVIEEVADLWAFERGDIFKGKYHVLGGTLSAMEGRGPSDLKVDSLVEKVESGGVDEVIIATNATVDGQTTAHYITERLKDSGVKVTRLAHGIPIGGELDYLDEGTLSTALKSRQIF